VFDERHELFRSADVVERERGLYGDYDQLDAPGLGKAVCPRTLSRRETTGAMQCRTNAPRMRLMFSVLETFAVPVQCLNVR
jgi:hypothetical protein